MWRVRTSAFSRRVASKPSTPGSDRSMRIAAGIVVEGEIERLPDGAGDGDAVAADVEPLGVHLARFRIIVDDQHERSGVGHCAAV